MILRTVIEAVFLVQGKAHRMVDRDPCPATLRKGSK
jgi:hypothetical protein